MKEVVKWFKNKKGCGCIKYKDTGSILICYFDNQNNYKEIELFKED